MGFTQQPGLLPEVLSSVYPERVWKLYQLDSLKSTPTRALNIGFLVQKTFLQVWIFFWNLKIQTEIIFKKRSKLQAITVKFKSSTTFLLSLWSTNGTQISPLWQHSIWPSEIYPRTCTHTQHTHKCGVFRQCVDN